MAIRLGALAKELGVENKVLVERAQQLGLNVKSHLSFVEDADAEHLRRMLKGGRMRHEKKPPVVVSPTPVAPAKPIRKVVKKAAAPKPAKKEKPIAPSAPAPAAAAPEVSVVPPPPPPKPQVEAPVPPATAVQAPVVQAKPTPTPVTAPPPVPKPPEAPVTAPVPPVTETPPPSQPTAVAPTPPPVTPKPAEPPISIKQILIKGGGAIIPTTKPVTVIPPALMKVPRAPAKPPTPPTRPTVVESVSRVEAIEERLVERKDKEVRRGKVLRKVSALSEGEEGTVIKAGQAPVKRPRRVIHPVTPAVSATRAVVTPRATKFELEEPVTVKSFSETVGIRASLIIAKLMQNNIMATINHVLDADTVQNLAKEFKVEVTIKKPRDLEAELAALQVQQEDTGELQPRPPVVTLMGHVDHGKTTLLDYIRKSNVAAGEAGGITQHIGAYKVEKDGRQVVFLDTPGHEAFTAMRARGANVTDLVVLVVAADDGVQPQTEEAINHARAANVPIVVAINKCDKPTANPMRVKQQLVGLNLVPEEWGGKTVCVEVSALTGKGVDELLEMLILEAELLDLKANPKGPARGTVLEARISQERGVVATVLVRNGTLHRGDVILCGSTWGRVRAMCDDRGRQLKEAGPASPVEIYGLTDVPEAGDEFLVLEDAEKARMIAEDRARRKRQASLVARQHVTLDNLYSRIAEGNVRELPIVLKADVKGSLEVLQKSLSELSTPEVKVRILHAAVGGITPSDVLLADASDAIIIGFHVVAEEAARRLAEEKGVDVRLYEIIYEVINDLKKALSGLLTPEKKEVVLGHAQVRQVFKISKVGNVAGCFVTDGRVTRNSMVRLVRDNVVIYTGRIASLKHLKDDVREVREGFECGIKIEGYDDLKVGDFIEIFEVQEVARTVV